jgi:hypothetical protein
MLDSGVGIGVVAGHTPKSNGEDYVAMASVASKMMSCPKMLVYAEYLKVL